ncbi:SLC13 family permease [Erythrobacter sp. HA6-11]
MTARVIGLVLGPLAFAITVLTAPPAGMPEPAWLVAGLVVWMATWWMTEAIPMTATALLPFVILPFGGIMTAKQTAGAYYSDILFLLLGGAFLALAIERTGLHRRLAVLILSSLKGRGGQTGLLLAFMMSAALLSMLISNTSTTLIMMPMALAVLAAGEANKRASTGGAELAISKDGLSGALPLGIAFAANIGGLGTLVGSPTNAIAVGLLDELIGVTISFAQWMMFGLPLVIVGIPIAAFVIIKAQRVGETPFDAKEATQAIADSSPLSSAEKRVLAIVAITFAGWMTRLLLAPYLPEGSWTDGTIAIIASLALFLLPDGTGRPLLVWSEADRAPWGVIMMFGGGLALAAGMKASGLDTWLGDALLPLEIFPLLLVAMGIVAMVILVTEFASNVATATAIIPVVAALVVALGVDPILLALPAALAASWGFMLPAGTGPNAIAWATGRIKIERMVGAGFILDLIGIVLIVAMVWLIAAVV